MKESGPYLPAAVWTYGDFIGVLISGLAGSAIAIGILAGSNLGSSDSVQLVTATGGEGVAMIVLLTYLSRRRGTGSFDLDFGLRIRPPDIRGLLIGIILQFVVIFAVLNPMALLLGIQEPPQQDVAGVASGASGIVARLAVGFMIVVVAPLLEEMLFRGVLLSRLRRSMTAGSAITISAAVFAAIHLLDPSAAFVVPGLFVIGLVLGYQALRTGNIGLSIMTHAGVNLAAVIGLVFNLRF